MGFKEVLKNIGEKQKERKEMLRQMDQQIRMQKIVEDRTKSSNERELERYQDEDREQEIKEHLEYARKKRDEDIKFGHNPIDAKNIMKAEWEILKEKNQFSKKSNLFTNQNSILKNNNRILNTNKRLLKSSNKLTKGGNMFKI